MPYLAKIAAQALVDAEASAAAKEAERVGELVAAARERLHAVLGQDADADVLSVADVTDAAVVVLTDGSVCLAITAGGLVAWVTKVDGQWETKASVDSLATLGAALVEAGVA